MPTCHEGGRKPGREGGRKGYLQSGRSLNAVVAPRLGWRKLASRVGWRTNRLALNRARDGGEAAEAGEEGKGRRSKQDRTAAQFATGIQR
jgi:hypothetical protein